MRISSWSLVGLNLGAFISAIGGAFNLIRLYPSDGFMARWVRSTPIAGDMEDAGLGWKTRLASVCGSIGADGRRTMPGDGYGQEAEEAEWGVAGQCQDVEVPVVIVVERYG